MDKISDHKVDFKDLSFTGKLEHIWFYHKWHILIALVFAIMIVICISQCSVKDEPDAMLMYLGDRYMPVEYVRYFNEDLEAIMSTDYNDDGEKTVDILQIRLDMAEGSDGKKQIYNPSTQTETLERIEVETATGKSVIYILEPTLFEQYKHVLAPLEEVLGYKPDGAIDEYGIALCEIPAYKETYLGSFPEKSVLCIRAKRTQANMFTKADNDNYYRANAAFFKELVEWQVQ